MQLKKSSLQVEHHLFIFALLFLSLIINGCGRSTDLKPDKILIKSGNYQCLPPQTISKPLVVEVLGPHIPGLLGGKGGRKPVVGAKVTFTILPPQTKALLVTPAVVFTDKGGFASAKINVKDFFGDVYVKASIEVEEEIKKVVFRLTSGVTKSGDNQEGATDSLLSDPLSLTIFDPKGKPIPGVKVFFKLEGDGNGASLSQEEVLTDDAGVAQTFLTLGKGTGKYYVSAEIADPGKNLFVRGIRFQAMAISKTRLITTLLGGLAVFIFGMRLMSDGLRRVAGNRLRNLLKILTKNRIIAVIVGMTVTALIQSSSACTVMVVGFVNAGLMNLVQAIGVIFGANIGTTITAQIIAFKLSELAYPSIVIGLILTFVAKRDKNHFWGQALMGFGLLFLGMQTMSEILKPLKDSPTFVNFFHGFDCAPINGRVPFIPVCWALFIGTAMTVIIQSSSATVGLTMALAGSGLINFYTAFPIILGDNIGTTITAILASIPANRTAKQAACAHTLFNVIGAGYMILLLFVPYKGQPIFLSFIDYITPGEVFSLEAENIHRHIAMAHSFFNIFNVIIFLPFVSGIAFLCRKIVPVTTEEEEMQLQYLEPHLLDTPELALNQVIRELAYMARLVLKSIDQAYQDLNSPSPQYEKQIAKREENIDRLQGEITNYLVELSRRELTEEQSKTLPMLMHSVNDLERAGDAAENILELGDIRRERKDVFSEIALQEINEMFQAVYEQISQVSLILENRDQSAISRVFHLEEQINTMEKKLNNNHIDRLEKGVCDISAGVLFIELIANFEKIGDRMLNVAQRVEIIFEMEL